MTYRNQAEVSTAHRNTSRDMVQALEEALAAPSPGREAQWLRSTVTALGAVADALTEQSRSDQGPDSLLAKIQADEPRLAPRIARLHAEHDDIRDAIRSLQRLLEPTTGTEAPDVVDVRERLAAIAHRFRRHRARETDLVYEAVNVDLGGGD